MLGAHPCDLLGEATRTHPINNKMNLYGAGSSVTNRLMHWTPLLKSIYEYHINKKASLIFIERNLSGEIYYIHEACLPAVIHTMALYSKCAHARTTSLVMVLLE